MGALGGDEAHAPSDAVDHGHDRVAISSLPALPWRDLRPTRVSTLTALHINTTRHLGSSVSSSSSSSSSTDVLHPWMEARIDSLIHVNSLIDPRFFAHTTLPCTVHVWRSSGDGQHDSIVTYLAGHAHWVQGIYFSIGVKSRESRQAVVGTCGKSRTRAYPHHDMAMVPTAVIVARYDGTMVLAAIDSTLPLSATPLIAMGRPKPGLRAL
ncbi:hypothetical protein IAQ61_007770 [Plenodomus lingam]|uniref:uncharacterized protein n=1 Tax=Leptosphaeria maculans TaxID=5022 RepID=UPI00331E541D|nr:hypothetical protein IAQ61_007770 [Plenodomus lingam]